MLFAKSGIELIILTVVFKMNQLQYALTWILLIMMVVTAILQVSCVKCVEIKRSDP